MKETRYISNDIRMDRRPTQFSILLVRRPSLRSLFASSFERETIRRYRGCDLDCIPNCSLSYRIVIVKNNPGTISFYYKYHGRYRHPVDPPVSPTNLLLKHYLDWHWEFAITSLHEISFPFTNILILWGCMCEDLLFTLTNDHDIDHTVKELSGGPSDYPSIGY